MYSNHRKRRSVAIYSRDFFFEVGLSKAMSKSARSISVGGSMLECRWLQRSMDIDVPTTCTFQPRHWRTPPKTCQWHFDDCGVATKVILLRENAFKNWQKMLLLLEKIDKLESGIVMASCNCLVHWPIISYHETAFRQRAVWNTFWLIPKKSEWWFAFRMKEES